MDEIDPYKLPMFDIEYIFLQLRARSVGEKIPIQYSLPDDKCEKSKSDAATQYLLDNFEELLVQIRRIYESTR